MKVSHSAVWQVSLDELLRLFREALLALVPVVEQAHMAWKEPDAYDDWDAIAAALYSSLVISAVENAANSQVTGSVVGYDVRLNSYERRNFIASWASAEGDQAFVCFETRAQPFDTCLLAILDRNGRVTGHTHSDYQETKFKLLKLEPAEARAFDTLDVVL